MRHSRSTHVPRRILVALLGAALAVPALTVGSAQAAPATPDTKAPAAASAKAPRPTFTDAVAHDRSAPARDLARAAARKQDARARVGIGVLARPERGAAAQARNGRFAPDAALSKDSFLNLKISPPIANFEGLSNEDNFKTLGIRVNPPDPIGDVGPRHYVEAVNVVWGVYSKTGQRLLGPAPLGSLWEGFAVEDCADSSGDPVVVHDQFADRWIILQFTTRGLDDPTLPFYNCVAVSATSDPTGAYHRYAFTSGMNFPDYPKLGVWSNSYVLTTREFGPTTEYGIGVYGLEKSRMLRGEPARSVRYFIDGSDEELLPLIGDGLLPPDIDGRRLPPAGAHAPIVGTQDDDAAYGAKRDAINIWNFRVDWFATPISSLYFAKQLPVKEFDSIFPCAPTSRDCLPQPGITDRNQYLDILSYRQRPTWRLAYRNWGGIESLVTSQSVEARPGIAGMRWYEIDRIGPFYWVGQQGTYAPNDGVHRWMGSIAQDRIGGMALGYSVVNGTDVYPGIRYTGRLPWDPKGTMPRGERVLINGTGVQTSTNSRWGDYTSMNVDPVDDCTFWYVNEYYTKEGAALAPLGNGWQTRIGSFRLPFCF